MWGKLLWETFFNNSKTIVEIPTSLLSLITIKRFSDISSVYVKVNHILTILHVPTILMTKVIQIHPNYRNQNYVELHKTK